MSKNHKNSLPLSITRAEKQADEILAMYGIDDPVHIRTRDLAYALGVAVRDAPLRGAAARLTRLGNRAVIRVADQEIYQGRKRFSIAHELGHFVLGHGEGSEIVCSDEDMIASLRDANRESEANAFAGELLLPTALVAKACDVKEVTFDPIRNIADRFRTSLTATALRFVRLCPEMCALVLSKDQRVKWVFKSDDFWPYIAVGKKLDPRTLAYDFFRGREMRQAPEEVEAEAWLDTERSGDIEEVVEHAVAMPGLHSVLALIWIRS
jgi:hypothetical protein